MCLATTTSQTSPINLADLLTYYQHLTTKRESSSISALDRNANPCLESSNTVPNGGPENQEPTLHGPLKRFSANPQEGIVALIRRT